MFATLAARCWTMAVNSILVCALSVCVAHAQLSTVNMSQVVGSLARQFETIRNEGLGIDSMERAYLDAQYTFSTITDSDIEALLTDSSITTPINSIISLFNNISSNDFGGSSPLTPTDCCTTGGGDACCYSCNNSNQLSMGISGAFSQANLGSGSQLFFGFSDGPLLTYPSEAQSNCTIQDARLQRWYGRSVRQSLEVVIVLDLRNTSGFFSEIDIERLKEAARFVLSSLTQNDWAAVVRADRLSQIAPVVLTSAADTQNPKVLPLCDDTLFELEQFVISVSEITPNYTSALLEGVSLFSDRTDTDKVIIFMLPGLRLFSGIDNLIPLVTQAIADRGNNVGISVYRSLDDGSSDDVYPPLAQIALGGEDVILGADLNPPLPPIAPNVGGFYSRVLANSTPSSDPVLGHSVSSIGNNVLTISLPFINDSNLIGVFHAVIPLDEQILVSPLTELRNRYSSYIFGASLDRRLLFHPLLPGNVLKDVLVTDFETDGVITGLLDTAQNSGMVHTAPVMKTHLLSTTGSDPHGFVVRKVPSSYHCRDNGLFFICILIADEDLTSAILMDQSVNLAALYADTPSRLPIYHDLMLSELSSQCDYFCKLSVTDRISFQLTSPNQPPTVDADVVEELSKYIAGPGTKPSWVQEGVAADIGLGSAVATSWINVNSVASDYITRRHLATPSGAYLTFPPSQLDSEFLPTRAEWYTSSQAHPTLLTLTPPHEDPLREGAKYTVSLGYALRTPITRSDATLGNIGQTLSVAAAELTLESLGVFIRQALPLCGTSGPVSCFLLDDVGNIIYDSAVVSNPRFLGGVHFLGQQFLNNFFQERRTLITNLLGMNNVLTKMECADYFNLDVKTRRFYGFDTTSDESVSSIGGGGCIDYMIQRIPGTNSFLVVLQTTRNCNSLCFCTHGSVPICADCKNFQATGCECPCICPDDCSPSTGIPACPLKSVEPVNYKPAITAMTPAPSQPFCFNQNCNCRTTADSCVGVRECNWCETQNKCVYNTECCNSDDGESCCTTSPQIERFDLLTCPLSAVCQQDPSGSLESDCPLPPTNPTPEPNTAVIVAGIVGSLVAVLLLVLLVIFIIWYQVCRNDVSGEDASRESAFDFSSKRTEASNPNALEEIKSDISAEKPNSPSSSANAQLVDTAKEDAPTPDTNF